jgi:sensor histidine kinase YesM
LKIADDKLDFFIENFIDEKSEKKEGAGLQNVRKRLDMIYGTDYKLITKAENEKYYVNLNINLTSTNAKNILM